MAPCQSCPISVGWEGGSGPVRGWEEPEYMGMLVWSGGAVMEGPRADPSSSLLP